VLDRPGTRNRKKDVYQGFGVPAYWIIEPDRDGPGLTVFELRSSVYEQTAHVTGAGEYHEAAPFPVTVTPSKLITIS
jgi:Uma2 family endonuclease